MGEFDGILGILEKQRAQMEEDLKRIHRDHSSAQEILDKLRELRERAEALERREAPRPKA
ncbi:MAG TPA: hypothetical protein VJ853_11075 [Thermoanaerobaculia bacterium]|nr:hypothetical protein [Thermoanaerobaculia bacterium]